MWDDRSGWLAVLDRRRSDSFFLRLYANDDFAQEHACDLMLLGRHVPGRFVGPPKTEPERWGRIEGLREIVGWPLPQREALELTRHLPDMLAELVRIEVSWLGENLY